MDLDIASKVHLGYSTRTTIGILQTSAKIIASYTIVYLDYIHAVMCIMPCA